MVNIYAEFVEDYMAVPVIKGLKTESERFAGAEETYCIEALMQDGKALQAGTSHFLGQNFAKAFDVKFTAKDGKQDYVWATSWGVSTRLMGALIMTHSDDKGLVLPPKLAPDQVVIVPIYRNDEQFELVSEVAKEVMKELRTKGVRVKFDNRDTYKPGWKFNDYELKGVPVRLAIGPRDVENGTLELARRDTLTKEFISRDDVVSIVVDLMDEIQKNLYNKAASFRTEKTTEVVTYDEFKELTPAGSLGDEMIRNLADRLVRVDLLFQAAELLKNQLQFRLKGVEKSQVGLNLALIYALAQEYGKVIEALDTTNGPNLPEELVADRLHLRAQALMNLDQRSSALLLLKTDKSLNADLIRSELYWRMKDWKSAALSLHNVVRQSGLKPGEDLSEIDAAKILNLATAYTLSGNERAIQRIRTDYSVPMAKTSVKGAFELLAQPLSIGMIDPASIAQRVKMVTNFRSYLDTYKERLKKERLSNLSRFRAIPKG